MVAAAVTQLPTSTAQKAIASGSSLRHGGLRKLHLPSPDSVTKDNGEDIRNDHSKSNDGGSKADIISPFWLALARSTASGQDADLLKPASTEQRGLRNLQLPSSIADSVGTGDDDDSSSDDDEYESVKCSVCQALWVKLSQDGVFCQSNCKNAFSFAKHPANICKWTIDGKKNQHVL